MTTDTLLVPEKTTNCLFCRSPNQRVLAKNDHGYAYLDSYPVTEGHTLVVPWRHAETYFDLDAAEVSALNALLQQSRQTLMAEDATISGFNIGMNCGASAGQSIWHCHIHLIPRRVGDSADPRGGVRAVIPSKRRYD
jgi:ATP adenylyltransferase